MKGLYGPDDVRNRAELRRESFFRPVELDTLANERINTLANERINDRCSPEQSRSRRKSKSRSLGVPLNRLLVGA